MAVSQTCVLLVVLLLGSTVTSAQDLGTQTPAPAPQPRRAEREPRTVSPQPRENIQARRNALARLAITGTLAPTRIEDRGPDLDIVRRNQARENLMTLAGGLQALYDLGAWPNRDAEFRNRVTEGVQESVEAVRDLLGFLEFGGDPPAPEPVELGEETFDEKVLRLVLVYLAIVEPTAGVIDGSTLDLDALNLARSGLAEIEAVSLSLPDVAR